AMYGSEGRQLAPIGSGQTNDLGEYRIFGLMPGSYFVAAQTPQDESEIGPAGLRVAKITYATAYFQDAHGINDATKLELHPGEETTANLTFSPTAVFNIAGHITGLPASSGPETPVQMMLFRAGEEMPA